MSQEADGKVLVVNCGSSSVKYQLFDMRTEAVLAKGLADRVGSTKKKGAVLKHQPQNRGEVELRADIPDHRAALRMIAEALVEPSHGVISSLSEISAVGHRVVHGGEKFSASVIIDEDVLKAVRDCIELAPLHNPPNLMGIEACRDLLPNVPQVAVFDTAFHSAIPRHAYLYAIPMEFYQNFGVRRYGFHGTSHRYVAQRARQLLREQNKLEPAGGKIITCHLGNGCSMTAVVNKKSVDTSMGMTPLEGLVMGTRSGDIDPALVALLAAKLHMNADGVIDYLNKKSGLEGLSGVGNDMRDILAACEEGNENAKAAVDIYCYRIRKYIGSYAAAMGGLTALVFTAGVGENSPSIRKKICEGLEFLGIQIDDELNERANGDRDINTPGKPVSVLVIATNEELLIARDTKELVSG